MRIAVPFEDEAVFQHFGHTKQFKVYEAEEGHIKAAAMLTVSGEGHGALADLLKDQGVDTLICGGIGEGAKRALSDVGIALYGGVTGDTDSAVKDYLSGQLKYNPDVSCDHHGEEHDHGGDHACGGNCSH